LENLNLSGCASFQALNNCDFEIKITKSNLVRLTVCLFSQ
jgi:hypothetical protein